VPVIEPVAVVNVTGVVLNSVVVMVNSVLLTTSSIKYLTPTLTPPNTVPVNSMFKSEYNPAVLLQVMRLFVAEVAVHVIVAMLSDVANNVC
jgi:hypothetical protein